MLLYEGMENRSNIIIDKDCTRIGQGDEADAVDDVLCKVLEAKKKKLKIEYI